MTIPALEIILQDSSMQFIQDFRKQMLKMQKARHDINLFQHSCIYETVLTNVNVTYPVILV